MKTDKKLRQDSVNELHCGQSIHPSHIVVEVENGIVTLSGNVESFSEKWNAEQAVRRVPGINALVMKINVVLPTSSQRSDTAITNAAHHILDWNTYIAKNHVHVLVKDGWITLAGEVDWGYQQLSLIRSFSFLMGVTGISDHLSISPTLPSRSLKADIALAIHRGARINGRDNGHDISIQVNHMDGTS